MAMRLRDLLRRPVLCLIVGAAMSLLASPAWSAARVALVIGNGAYQHVPALPNPPNDASDIAASFRRLGFDVRLVKNGNFDDMRRALLDFGHRARGAEMAIVFYAGHGMEIAGENWLIPVDAALRTDADAEQEAITLKSVMVTVSNASKLGLVLLDACRNSPFAAQMQRTLRTRSLVSRGFARVEPNGSVLVAYAAKDGTTAADGSGRNSPFTSALLKNLETPGLEINFLFRSVRDDVIAATHDQQEPFLYGSLSKEAIFLKPPLTPPRTGSPAVPTPAALPPPGPAADEVSWSLIKDTGNIEQLRRFIRQFPNSRRRTDAEQRIEKIANLPLDKPRQEQNREDKSTAPTSEPAATAATAVGMLTTQEVLHGRESSQWRVCIGPKAMLDDPYLKPYFEHEPGLRSKLKVLKNFQDAVDAFDRHECVAVLGGLAFLHRTFDNDRSRPGTVVVPLRRP